jgi:Skp family chaperone for outer membrane proteins
MSQGNSGTVNRKQQQTQESINRENLGEEKKMQTKIRTYITHNKGGKWELIKAPSVDSDGKKISCYLDEDCSLNL